MGRAGQQGEDVAQVLARVRAEAAAVFHDRVEDGSAFAGGGFADKEPVLFADGRGGGVRDKRRQVNGRAVGRMAFSTRLLSISTLPWPRKTSNSLHCPSA